MTKKCTRCTETKESREFTKDKRYAGGLFCWCKECKKQHARNNPQIATNWAKNNPEASKAIKDAYIVKNPVKVKASKSKWSKANPGKERAKVRKYQASKLNATPKWLSEEQIAQMIEIYATCPEGYEVDHIIPLRGKGVRGLHVPWNLRHLKIKANRQKSNKY